MKPQSIFLLFVLLGWQYTTIVQGSKFDLRTSNKFCGPQLSRALARICDYESQFEKRNGEFTVFNPLAGMNYDDHELDYNWPWISPHRARLIGVSGRSRDKRLVVDECCEKPCTISELMTYC